MSNQTWNNDPNPEGSGDDSAATGNNPAGYTPPGTDPNQGQAPGYQPPAWNAQQAAPSGSSGADAPGQGYNPPSFGGAGAPDQGGYTPPTGTSGTDAPWQGGYQPPSYGAPGQPSSAPSGSEGLGQGGYAPPNYSVPTTPDQSFGQTPSYGAPGQQQYGQPQGSGYGQAQTPYGAAPQGGYDPSSAAGGYGQPPSAQTPYGTPPQGGHDPNAAGGAFGQPQAPYGAPGGSYGAPAPYGAPGSYQPNPYAPAGPQLATWGRRALGGLIDFVAPAVVIGILISIVIPNGGYGANLVSYVLTLGWWAYNTGYRVATTGYSFGQKIGKVRVVMEDTGQTPTQNVAITRALSHFLDSLCLIGFLFPLWDAKKQTFADKIAKTVVIDEQNVQR